MRINTPKRNNKNLDLRVGTKRENTDTIPMGYATLMCLATVLFSAIIPLIEVASPYTTAIAWVICAVCGSMVVFTSRSFFSVIVIALALTFITSSTGTVTAAAAILGIFFSMGMYSAMIACAKIQHLAFLIAAPVLSYGLCVALTGDPIISASAIIWIPSALVLGIATKKGKDRTSAITAFTIISAVIAFALVAVFIYLENGGMSYEIILKHADILRENLAALIKNAIIAAGNGELLTEYLLREIQGAAETCVNLLMGLVVAVLVVVGFFVHKIQCAFFDKFELEDLLNSSVTPISISTVSALLFVILHIISYSTSAQGSRSFAAVVAENVCIMLIPAFVAVGLSAINSLSLKIGALIMALWIGLFFMASVLESSLLTILALIGAAYTLVKNIDSWAKKHYSKGDNV